MRAVRESPDASRAVLDKAIYKKIPGTTHATIFPEKLDDA